ncbi:hypothetical protein [Motiliproteus sediminis]|uniref:hypothetical protein n=1 Tax=Motiliproteus sediminis TaxID=1468178 RepID=UPI001AEF9545|nr:hypothetical protein [Motiliproteus sediminis]
MRIGAASNLPPFLPKPSARQAPVAVGEQDEGGGKQRSAAPLERADAARQSDNSRFYSTDRTLPFSGREAISLYLTNASLNWQPGESELLGIDLYA